MKDRIKKGSFRLSDTSADAEQVRLAIYRRMPAWRKVQLVDSERAAFYRRHFNNDVADPLNFDLMLNTASLSVAQCADIVTHSFKRRFSGPAN